jgi:6-phosphogluconolactonase (cycloisomerase 2 family)
MHVRTMHVPNRLRALLATLVVAPMALAVSALPASAHDGGASHGHGHGDEGRSPTIYTSTNAAAGNELLSLTRTSDGNLAVTGRVATGGTGTGGGLGSQGAVATSEEGDVVLVADAGSDQVSAFARGERGSLRLLNVASSGGDQPVSVTVHDDTVYVLNAGDGTISGLRLGRGGLRPIAGSTRSITGAAGAQVSFTPSGRQLVVTEKATNTIDVFPVGRDGRAGAPVANPSNGATPFGFAFDEASHLIVSNAAGGARGASSVSSYRVGRDGHLVVLDGPVATGQSAACWVVTTEAFAYTTNTGSGTVSGLGIGNRGDLALLDADGVTATTGTTPIDAVVAGGDLYTLNSTSHTITVHGIGDQGALTLEGSATDLPAGVVGLAAA